MNSTDDKIAKFNQMLQEMKQDYLESFPKRISLIKKYMSEDKWQSVHEEYHKLKGTGKTYGFSEISIVCEVLELLSMKQPVTEVALFQDSIGLLERMHQTYLQNQPFELEKDPVATRLLALK